MDISLKLIFEDQVTGFRLDSQKSKSIYVVRHKNLRVNKIPLFRNIRRPCFQHYIGPLHSLGLY